MVEAFARKAWARALARGCCRQQRCESPKTRSWNLRAVARRDWPPAGRTAVHRRSNEERSGRHGARHSGDRVHGTACLRGAERYAVRAASWSLTQFDYEEHRRHRARMSNLKLTV